MLDFTRFSEVKEYIVPIVGKWGKANGRFFAYSGVQNGSFLHYYLLLTV